MSLPPERVAEGIATESAVPDLAAHKLRRGLTLGITAFSLWGLLPVYLHPLSGHIHPLIVLGQRVVWSVVTLAIMLTVIGGWQRVFALARKPGMLGWLTLTTTLLATNWYLFIYASTRGMNIQASLGYFITPLLLAVLGVWVLGEQLRVGQIAAFVLAGIGVIYLSVGLHAVPTLALALAGTWGSYGLVRKRLHVESIPALTIETAILAIPASIGLIWAAAANPVGLAGARPELGWAAYLALTGVLTTVPLLCFSSAAKALPLSVLGLLQFIGPTVQFLVAVLFFGEQFTHAHQVAFPIIWAGIGIYVAEGFWANRSAASKRLPLSSVAASR